MSRVVFDIETLGLPLESFDETQREYLLKSAQSDEERKEAIQKFSLHPATAQIAAVGLYNPDTNKGKILFQADQKLDYYSPDDSIHFVSAGEKEILTEFWKDIAYYNQFVTFNGRGFDCPFLMFRSAVLQVQPTRNLLPSRYDPSLHCDLLEQFTFYGAIRKFNLDFYCRVFGVDSPKAQGVSGGDVARLFEEKKFKEIADYCVRDLKATAELFRAWETYLKV